MISRLSLDQLAPFSLYCSSIMHLYESLENPVEKIKVIPIYQAKLLKTQWKKKEKHHDIYVTFNVNRSFRCPKDIV